MSEGQKRGKSSARLGVVLFAVVAVMSFGVSLTLAAPPFEATIEVDDITDMTVTVSGTADSPSNATHHMLIEWGDGEEDALPNFSTDAPWNWGPVSHTYDEAGDYAITATLIHSNENGNDRGEASDSVDVTVGDDGSDDDGSDDDSTDGTETPTVVLGKTVTKKPVVSAGGPLAKTGPEHAGLVVIGLMLLMAGATIRWVTSDEV